MVHEENNPANDSTKMMSKELTTLPDLIFNNVSILQILVLCTYFHITKVVLFTALNVTQLQKRITSFTHLKATKTAKLEFLGLITPFITTIMILLF